MWPEAIITYAKWGDTLGALSLTLEPCGAASRSALSARRARGYAVARRDSPSPGRAAQAASSARGRGHLHPPAV